MNGFPVTVAFPMHWGDMDAMGHANNVRFFRWFESGRVAFFERFSIPLQQGVAPILAHTSCDYLKPVVYPAQLVVGVRLAKLGRTSLTLEQVIARAEAPDDPVARGIAVIVLLNYATGEKVPIPEGLRATLTSAGTAVPPNVPDGSGP
jgi:acyl-CoA thioester hydrolase